MGASLHERAMALEVGVPLVHLMLGLRHVAGLPVQPALRGLRFDAADLANPEARMHWEDFTILLDRCLVDVGSEAALESLMGQALDHLLPGAPCRGAFQDLQTFYLWLTVFCARRWHSSLETSTRIESDGRILVEHRIPPPFRASRALALATEGLFRGAPRLMGLPDATLSCSFDERCGLYWITPPPMPETFDANPAPDSSSNDLSPWQAELDASLATLDPGLALLESTSIRELGDRLAQSLRESTGFTAGRLFIRQSHGEIREVHRWGEVDQALVPQMLTQGARIIGRLELGPPRSLEPAEEQARQELLAWLAIALERQFRSRQGPAPPREPKLSPRLQQVRDLLVQGYSDKEIARSLGTSPRTVGHQISELLRRQGVSNRTALAHQHLAHPLHLSDDSGSWA